MMLLRVLVMFTWLEKNTFDDGYYYLFFSYPKEGKKNSYAIEFGNCIIFGF